MTARDSLKDIRFAMIIDALATPGFAKTHLPAKLEPLAQEAIHNYAKCARFSKGHDYCLNLGNEIAYNGILYAGGVAEAFLEIGLKGRRLGDFVASQPETPQVPRNVTEAVGLCQTRRAEPDKADALLVAVPASDKELSALQALGNPLMGCVAKGQKMPFNQQGMRAIIALAAFQFVQPAPSEEASHG